MTTERWLRLMKAWGFEANPQTFDALVDGYSGKGRHYHTAKHVSACLEHLDAYLDQVENPREVKIAPWFHDAIYKPLSSKNEKESADWAASFLSENGAKGTEVSRVHRLIMVTEHNAPTQTADEAVLVDIDLSILGAIPATYDMFERAVRKEYKLVPSFLYRKKRAEVLRGFLAREKIYTSGCFPPDFERQARENLLNAITTLEGNA
ncbi:MAG: N-methyl-D-aspartate receptor NMDAR2C subunit [Pseudomonadota bacterium]